MLAVVDYHLEVLPCDRFFAVSLGIYDERYLCDDISELVKVPAGCLEQLRKRDHFSGAGRSRSDVDIKAQRLACRRVDRARVALLDCVSVSLDRENDLVEICICRIREAHRKTLSELRKIRNITLFDDLLTLSDSYSMARRIEIVNDRDRIAAEVHAVEHESDVLEDPALQLGSRVSVFIERAGILQNDIERSQKLIALVVRKPCVHHREMLFKNMFGRRNLDLGAVAGDSAVFVDRVDRTAGCRIALGLEPCADQLVSRKRARDIPEIRAVRVADIVHKRKDALLFGDVARIEAVGRKRGRRALRKAAEIRDLRRVLLEEGSRSERRIKKIVHSRVTVVDEGLRVKSVYRGPQVDAVFDSCGTVLGVSALEAAEQLGNIVKVLKDRKV